MESETYTPFSFLQMLEQVIDGELNDPGKSEHIKIHAQVVQAHKLKDKDKYNKTTSQLSTSILQINCSIEVHSSSDSVEKDQFA